MGVVMAEHAPVYEFQGRVTEEAVSQLAVLPEMEWRTSVLRLILTLQERVDENTDVTADTQEMVSRSIGKVDEMYELLQAARKGLRAVGRVGDGLAWIGERGVKLAIGGAVLIALVAYMRTGHFPDWLFKLFL